MKRGVEVVPPRVMWLITLRMILVTFILFLTAFMHMRGMRDYHPHQFRGLYIIAGSAYLETALAVLLHARGVGRFFPPHAQLMLDNLLIAAIILVTDGVDSIFSVLFFFTAIAGSILYYRRGGLLIALQGSAAYLLAILVPFLHPLWPLLDLGERYGQESVLSVLYRGTVNTTAFLMVSLLSSYLSESLRRAKIQLAREMNSRQGFLDAEDQKTLISFVLFGDPLAQPFQTRVTPKVTPHLSDSAIPVQAVCERSCEGEAGSTVSLETIAHLKSVVAQYLPGMNDAQVRLYHEHQTCANACGHCGTGTPCGLSVTGSKNQLSMKPQRRVVTLRKSFERAQRTHRQYARLTLDERGKIVKMVVSH